MEVLLKCGTGKDASTKQELQVNVTAALHRVGSGNLRSKRCGCKQHRHCLQATLQDIWPHLTNLKWIHSASAGVEKLLFPDLIKSKVLVTNAKASPASHCSTSCALQPQDLCLQRSVTSRHRCAFATKCKNKMRCTFQGGLTHHNQWYVRVCWTDSTSTPKHHQISTLPTGQLRMQQCLGCMTLHKCQPHIP